ncbi:hypothetical protein [Yaniella halotolerans]|uniref:hypothetical protein n=1 Tax=Yaniella halotolerans TaxID=225453 RepID=UPI0003B382A1|nr:hypothetical protein [Yaniella halotolerans]
MTQEYAPPPLPESPASRSKGLATISLLLGLVALVVSWLSIVGMVISVLAVVLGIIARRRSQAQVLSILGIITGTIGLVISLYLTTTAGFFLHVEEPCGCIEEQSSTLLTPTTLG